MQKIRIASDLHCCMWGNRNIDEDLFEVIPFTKEDKSSVLCIAGDTGLYSSFNDTIKPYLTSLSDRFKAVVLVSGNHEWYNSSEWYDEIGVWKYQALPENVYFLQDDYVIINEVVFIGSTLWTDFNSRDEIAMFHAEHNMSDFRCIKKREGDDRVLRVTPEDTIAKHMVSKRYIFDALKIFKDKKCVVITHHMPSVLCVDKQYEGSLLNYAFYSELGPEIVTACKPDIWIHGHTHSSVDVLVGKTNIICNPFGYKDREENRNYNPILIREV